MTRRTVPCCLRHVVPGSVEEAALLPSRLCASADCVQRLAALEPSWASLDFQPRIDWKHGGVRGLYQGLGPNFLKALPAISISYVCFEKSKSFLMEERRQRLQGRSSHGVFKSRAAGHDWG